MNNMDEYSRKLYSSDRYIENNPMMHEEDSPWKMEKIVPLIDNFISRQKKKEINLLDVGGGAGLIMSRTAAYMENKFSVKVNKFILDLSPGMLEVQKKRNPDFKMALNEDILKTSLCDKEIDLTLMVDVLEHVSMPSDVLTEVRRISKFVILKVPLENNLYLKIQNFIRRGKPRKLLLERFGHINVYSFRDLRTQIEKYAGKVLYFNFTNVFDYYRKSERYKQWRFRTKLPNLCALYLFKLSPRLCSITFNDFVMVLMECYEQTE